MKYIKLLEVIYNTKIDRYNYTTMVSNIKELNKIYNNNFQNIMI